MVQRVLRNAKPQPRFISPMECLRVAKLPEGDGWRYVKQQVPFDFLFDYAQSSGYLTAGFSTAQITAFAVICCGRNDRAGEMWAVPLKRKTRLNGPPSLAHAPEMHCAADHP
jgi:hypothetical protein